MNLSRISFVTNNKIKNYNNKRYVIASYRKKILKQKKFAYKIIAVILTICLYSTYFLRVYKRLTLIKN